MWPLTRLSSFGNAVFVECAVGSAPCLTAVDDMGYEIDQAEVAYWGRCPDCLARAGASSSTGRSTRRPRNQPKTARQGGPTATSTDREENPRD